MRFKEGSRVEVLRKKKEACGSWFPAKILSKVGNVYTVRYELYLSSKGEPVEEKVYEEDVRPCPPPAHGGESWVVGDVADVFDLRAWRVGKVAKVLSNGYVVIRLFNSIQLKKFHVSNLRVRCAWRDNRWISIGKASEKKAAHSSTNYTTYMDSGANGVKCDVACTRQKSDHDYVRSFPAGRNDNESLNFHGSSFPDEAAIRRSSNKRRWILEGGEHHPLAKRALPRKVDALPFANYLVGKNCMQSSSPPLPITEESIECSVASCSGNDLPEYTVQDTRNENHSREISGSQFDDTSSSFAPKSGKGCPDVSEDELAANVHELELHAYKSTVQALYASGPLSWEQESLLTNLRMSLHITNEEHLLQPCYLIKFSNEADP